MRLIVILLLTLIIDLPAIAKPGDLLCVTKNFLLSGVRVKSQPNNQSDTRMTIGAGRSVVEFSRKDGWVYVGVSRSGGVDGYVPERALSNKDLDGMPCGS